MADKGRNISVLTSGVADWSSCLWSGRPGFPFPNRPEGVAPCLCLTLFEDDLVLLASSEWNIQHALGWFAAECEVVGMKISISKTEAIGLCLKMVDCSLWDGNELLPRLTVLEHRLSDIFLQ